MEAQWSDCSEPRIVSGVTIIGPGLFVTDAGGKPLSPIASAFPQQQVIVTGRGIHAMQTETMVEFLQRETRRQKQRELSDEEEQEIYRSSVSLLVRHPVVLIRSDPAAMDRVFAADALLQRLLPKENIQFTGIQQTEVRKELRRRGESWRISPQPRSTLDIQHLIESSRIQVNTGATYYYNAPTGGRYVTFQEFMRIRPLLRSNRQEALARLKEIFRLTRLSNKLGVRELSFFLPADKTLETDDLEQLISHLAAACSETEVAEAEYLFDRFSAAFAAGAGSELLVDNPDEAAWRTTMFCRLYDINEKEVEEWALGLSPEFRLNVRWLPGARIAAEPLFESAALPRVRELIRHYMRAHSGVLSINVGRVESSLTVRDRTGEHRDVYLVVLELADGSEDLRIVRMIKWDVMHRVNRGTPLHQAIAETFQYRDYIFDRLRAAAELGIPGLGYTEIRLEECVEGLGWIPAFFFDRPYLPGIVTDKIPLALYAQPGFVTALAGLLGVSAAVSLVLGRACPRSGHVFFDDGDEVVQLDADGRPQKLTIVDITGSFTDWRTPVAESLPHCLWHLSLHLERANQNGIGPGELRHSVAAFAASLAAEIQRMQLLLQRPESGLRTLFADRTNEPGGIRHRWDSVLCRLQATDTRQLLQIIAASPHFESFQ